MKQKILVLVLLALALAYRANAQFYHDFTAVTPTGQTLYYTIHGNNVTIVNPYSMEGGAGYVSGDMIIPDSVQHISDNDTIIYAVTALYYSAFRYCDSLTSVVLPNGITSIPYCAFEFKFLWYILPSRMYFLCDAFLQSIRYIIYKIK